MSWIPGIPVASVPARFLRSPSEGHRIYPGRVSLPPAASLPAPGQSLKTPVYPSSHRSLLLGDAVSGTAVLYSTDRVSGVSARL